MLSIERETFQNIVLRTRCATNIHTWSGCVLGMYLFSTIQYISLPVRSPHQVITPTSRPRPTHHYRQMMLIIIKCEKVNHNLSETYLSCHDTPVFGAKFLGMRPFYIQVRCFTNVYCWEQGKPHDDDPYESVHANNEYDVKIVKGKWKWFRFNCLWKWAKCSLRCVFGTLQVRDPHSPTHTEWEWFIWMVDFRLAHNDFNDGLSVRYNDSFRVK